MAAVLTDVRIGGEGDAVLCSDVCVRRGSVTALDHLDLTVARGRVVALLGPSGSGKSSLLHTIAGILAPGRGVIRIGDRVVAGNNRFVPAEHRPVGMVFQNFALWPHLTVAQTVGYPLRRKRLPRSAIRTRVTELLRSLDIDQLADRRPGELSGGQQQRVGLARALARDAEVLLLDEPTAHLDTALRQNFLDVVASARVRDVAVIYATHDAAEALSLADEVTVLVDGRVAQTGSPEAVYAEPASPVVARLSGPAPMIDTPDGLTLLRPDWLAEGGPLRAEILGVAFAGPHTDYRLRVPGGELRARLPGPPRFAVGEASNWTVRRSWTFPAPAG